MPFPFSLIPVPASFKERSSACDLKERLDWGEPALTIIDVRSRDEFNAEHITGAISMPAAEVVARAAVSLESERDIYIYADSDERTAEVVATLREAGFQRVAELTGGLPGWKAVRGPVEGSFAALA